MCLAKASITDCIPTYSHSAHMQIVDEWESESDYPLSPSVPNDQMPEREELLLVPQHPKEDVRLVSLKLFSFVRPNF